MATTAAADPLDDDGINPTHALILEAYWMLRREFAAESIGSTEIAPWIRTNEPDLSLPSPSLAT